MSYLSIWLFPQNKLTTVVLNFLSEKVDLKVQNKQTIRNMESSFTNPGLHGHGKELETLLDLFSDFLQRARVQL